jgi:prophage antirepressor-like protein
VNSNTAPTVFQFHDNQIRTLLKDGNPWFVASDVCSTLGYRDTSNGTRWLDDDEKGTHIVSTLGGAQKVTIISESGLYALVLRSRKAEARKFAKWVTSEVLPAIRKTGSYLNDDAQHSIYALCSHVEFLHSWFKKIYPGLRILSPRLAAAAHDHFGDGVMFARGLVHRFGLQSNQLYAADYPWDAGYTERDEYRRRNQGLIA